MRTKVIAILFLLCLGLVACEPEEVIVEVTRIVTDTIIEQLPGEVVEVTQVFTEVEEVVVTATADPRLAAPQEVTRVVEVEVTRIVTATPDENTGSVATTDTPEAEVVTSSDEGLISFSSPEDPETLNELLGWQLGGSEANSYDLTLNPGALTLVGGPRTDQWSGTDSAPVISYPITGDFLAEVKVIFAPDENWQAAGIGVREIGNPTWLRIARQYNNGNTVWVTAEDNGSEMRLAEVEYIDDTVWLRIQRRGSIYNLSYSTNGTNWVDVERNLVFELSDDVELFLVTYSTTNTGAVAEFSDFRVTPQ